MAAGFSLMIAADQIRVGAATAAEKNDRPVRKPRRQIDETACSGAGQSDTE
jgi:hypothetical protein